MKRTLLTLVLTLAATAGRAAAVSTGTALCPGCSVIILSMTNVGAGRMSLYGYARKTTPGLDRWSRSAAVFDEAFAHASWTLPESVSLLTSLYPYAHGVWKRNVVNALAPEVRTLPGILRARGYATAAFTGGLDYSPRMTQMREFETAPENANFTGFSTTTAQAADWLKTHGAGKFFLLVQGYDAHCPFRPGPDFAGRFSAPWEKTRRVDASLCVRGFKSESGYRATYSGGCPQFPVPRDCSSWQGRKVELGQDDVDYLSARYDETVLAADARVSAFLESLDPALLERTIVVVTADHGEMFAKHGRFGRAGTLRGTHYDDVLRVPLLIRFPHGPRGRVAGLAQHVDVLPTILDALGLPSPPQTQGRSLAPLLSSGTAVNRFVFSGLPYNVLSSSDAAKQDFLKKTFPYLSVTETVRDERWKLIHERVAEDVARGRRRPSSDVYELYDVARDPEELDDLAADPQDAGELARLKARLGEWSRAMIRSARAAHTEPVSERLLKEARERGYW